MGYFAGAVDGARRRRRPRTSRAPPAAGRPDGHDHRHASPTPTPALPVAGVSGSASAGTRQRPGVRRLLRRRRPTRTAPTRSPTCPAGTYPKLAFLPAAGFDLVVNARRRGARRRDDRRRTPSSRRDWAAPPAARRSTTNDDTGADRSAAASTALIDQIARRGLVAVPGRRAGVRGQPALRRAADGDDRAARRRSTSRAFGMDPRPPAATTRRPRRGVPRRDVGRRRELRPPSTARRTFARRRRRAAEHACRRTRTRHGVKFVRLTLLEPMSEDARRLGRALHRLQRARGVRRAAEHAAERRRCSAPGGRRRCPTSSVTLTAALHGSGQRRSPATTGTSTATAPSTAPRRADDDHAYGTAGTFTPRCSPRTSAAARARRARACSSRLGPAPPPAKQAADLRPATVGHERPRAVPCHVRLGLPRQRQRDDLQGDGAEAQAQAPDGRNEAVPIHPCADGFRDDRDLQVHPAQDAQGEYAHAGGPAAGFGDRPRGPNAVGVADGADPAELRLSGVAARVRTVTPA